jgi:sugar transferase (PEP-CTERM/EpsH1 system associated)
LKILWVKAGGLFPPDTGGKIRSYQILKALARRHHVSVFTFYGAMPSDLHNQLEHQFARVVCLPLEVPAARSLQEVLAYGRNVFSALPYTVSKFCRPAVAKSLRNIVCEDKPDVIVCDFVFAAGVIPWGAGPPKVLFTHNVEALIWKRHYQVAHNPLWKAVSWWEFRTMERFERNCINWSDHVLTVSDHDRAIFSRTTNPSRITVIPTGVDIDYYRPRADLEKPNTLVFTGSMDWMPNEDGMVFFIRQIWPQILEQVPDASVSIVGRCPSDALLELAARQQKISVTGRVEDIRPHVHHGSVYIVPLRIGSGTRLKIFEAMAMGKAVVSTTIGAEGLPVQPGRDIVLADGAEPFASAVVALLQDPIRRVELGRAARNLVEEKHSWDSVVKPFEEVLEKLTGLGVSAKHPDGRVPTLSS